MDTETNNDVIIEVNEQETGVISVGSWVGTLLLLAIPFVNIIAIIYYLVSKTTHQSKKNYVYALLIIMAIALVLSFLFGASLFTLLPTQS